MKRIYHLSSCSTCQRILKHLNPDSDVELIDIKESNIDAKTLDWLKEKVGSYEDLFSKRAMKFRSMGLDKMTLTEQDFRNYMLEEYTFLKRPFIIHGEDVFIGNSQKVVDLAAKVFSKT
jgi:arsenate reductase